MVKAFNIVVLATAIAAVLAAFAVAGFLDLFLLLLGLTLVINAWVFFSFARARWLRMSVFAFLWLSSVVFYTNQVPHAVTSDPPTFFLAALNGLLCVLNVTLYLRVIRNRREKEGAD